MFRTLAPWMFIGTACASAVDDSGKVDSGEAELCREEITNYDQATAPVNGYYGNSYLTDLYEWNAVDWTLALDGAAESPFSRVFTYSAGFDPVVVEWVPSRTEDAIWPCTEDRSVRFFLSSEIWVDSTALHARLEGTLDLFADEPYVFR